MLVVTQYHRTDGVSLKVMLEVASSVGELTGTPARPRHEAPRAGDIRHCVPDVRRLATLGYQAGTAFADGIGETVEWVRGQLAEDRFAAAQGELQKRGLTL